MNGARNTTTGSEKQVQGAVLATIGFVLSPLSWWNDLVVNVPLAYLIAWPLSAVDQNLFLPAMIGAYWGSNVLGLVLLHIGVERAVSIRLVQGATSDANISPHPAQNYPRKSMLRDLLISLGYTALVAALVYSGVLRLPVHYFAG